MNNFKISFFLIKKRDILKKIKLNKPRRPDVLGLACRDQTQRLRSFSETYYAVRQLLLTTTKYLNNNCILFYYFVTLTLFSQ